MKKYRVQLEISIYRQEDVEAENEEEAFEKAKDQAGYYGADVNEIEYEIEEI